MTHKKENEMTELKDENAALRKAIFQLILLHHTQAESEARGQLPIQEVNKALRGVDSKIRKLSDLRNIEPEKACHCAQAIWALADEVSPWS